MIAVPAERKVWNGIGKSIVCLCQSFDSLLQLPRMMQTVHDFLEQFFKCHYCRRHFLKNFEAGSFGRDLAKTSRQQAGHGKFVLPISSDRGNVSVSILSPGKYYRRGFVTRRFGGDPFICTACFCLLQVVLYFWRFHNAVSVRVTAWHGCNTTDRRWPPSSVCSRRRWGFPREQIHNRLCRYKQASCHRRKLSCYC